MTKTVCEHDWIEDIDHKEAQACYNDGFNYYPYYYICTKCNARKKIQYGEPKKWYAHLLGWLKDLPSFLLFLILIPLFLILAPITIIIGAIIEDFSSKKKS